jgi:hypothetical protein
MMATFRIYMGNVPATPAAAFVPRVIFFMSALSALACCPIFLIL